MGKIAKHFKKINNNVAKKIIDWRWLTARDGLSDLNTLKTFYLNNQNWPKLNKIRDKVEAKININNYKTEMLWFQETPPRSGIGKIKLAEMLMQNGFKRRRKMVIKSSMGWSYISILR